MAYNRLILNDLQNEIVEIARQIQDVTKCKHCNLARNDSTNLFSGVLIKKKFNSKGDVVFNMKRIEAGYCLCKAKVSLKFSSIFNRFKLTYFCPMSHFYKPKKRQETKGFFLAISSTCF